MKGWRLGCAALAAWWLVGCMGGPDEQADSFAEQAESASVEQESVEAQWKHEEKKVYSENFGKGAGPEWSHRTVSRTRKGERKFLGPFSEQEVTLNLSGLPDHDEVEVQLELFVLKSWDGNDTTKGPGRWVASVDDGPVLLDATFSNLQASHPGLTGASMKGTLGYRDESGDGSKGYTIYPLSFTFRHTGDRLTLRFADPPRGEANEQWGLDSVKVKVRKKKGGDLLVSNNVNSSVLRYDGKTGDFVGVFIPPGAGGLNNPQELVYGPDGNLYIASFASREVLRFNGKTGAFIDIFVPVGSGGLGFPGGLIFGPDGNLYVADSFGGTNSVLRYDGTTGAFIDVFASGGGLLVPQKMAFDKKGNLFVVSIIGNNVVRYDENGAPFPAAGQPGAIFIPDIDAVTIAIGKDHKLYVGTTAGDDVLRFNAKTGAFIDVFVESGSGGLTDFVDMEFGPDGNLYIPDFLPATVLRFSGKTGNFIDVFVPAGTGANAATLTFMPSKRNKPHGHEAN
ncbi:hypothetical protein SAMN04488504_103586 [Myxococcus virescens]|uniref:SMP-30/Gluconolactonase/LRE-like region domain-containing protein n=2 Tax=Myxococcus virescens TaxID=83456 RepID=A0ABY0MN60_9BACT|nr:hypothetical protein SAMN04488504_103586 [Myxococcus virescens]